MEKNLYKSHIISLLLIGFIFVVSAEAQIQASKDNTLYENETGTISNGSGAYFFVGRTAAQGGTAIRRGLIAFDIAGQIPEGATITSVTLTMRMSRSVAGNQSVELYRLLADWGEGSSNATGQEGTGASAATDDATWLHTFYNNSFWSTAGGDFTASSSASQTVGGIGFYTWGSSTQMVNDVQNWLDNPQENFGWILLGDESSGTTAKRFDSRDNGTQANRPVLNVTFTTPNDPPVANNDQATTDEDTQSVIDILSNDTDSDGNVDPSTVTITGGPTNGTITNINSTNGNVTYEPDNDFNGDDSFTYTVEDNNGATSNEATVDITVLSVNDSPTANNDTPGTNEDNSVIIDILNNDSDIDDGIDPSTVTVTGSPSNGSITNINTTNGNITYQPDADYNGDDSFSYTVNDNSGATSNQAEVNITIQPVNDSPTASDDNPTTNEDITLIINILNNDDDIDDGLNSATVIVTDGPSNGTITNINNSNGQITYEPDNNYNGDDSFTYTVEDNSGATSNEAAVNIAIRSVNDPPTAMDDISNTEENMATIIDIINNDTDLDGFVNPASITITSNPSNGSITNINTQSGEITYNPDLGFNGNDQFIYTVTDDSGAVSNQAEVRISIGSVNDLPIAVDDNVETDEELAIQIDVLNNDSDPDGNLNPSSVIVTTNPDNGTITAINQTSGIITYMADTNFNGEDTFIYTVEDDSGAVSNEAIVTIGVRPVNDPPVALNDNVEIEEDTPLIINILNNDSDIDGTLNPVSVSIVNQPEMGTIENINTSSGAITYLPNENFFGMDQFTYTVSDDSGDVSNQATVSITIQTINDPPVITEIPPIIFNEDETFPQLLTDFQEYVTDPETPDSLLNYTFTQGTSISIELNFPAVIFSALPNWYGTDSITIIVSDGEYSDSSKIQIIVEPVNDPPLFVDLPDSIHFSNSDSYILELGDYIDDEDLPSDSLRWQFNFNDENLNLDFSIETWNLTLTAPDYQGSTTLIIIVTDDSSESAVDTVVVNVTDFISGLEGFSAELPDSYRLYQNYPNPFNPVTTINFSIPKQSRVILTVFNTLGQQMGIILDEVIPAGTHSVTYNAQELSSGVYFYSIQTEDFHRVMKMILLK
jgi:hypothetical protein